MTDRTYDPRQIGAQVWEVDRGGDAPIRGGTVVAVHEHDDRRTDELVVITLAGKRQRRKGGTEPYLEVATLRVDALEPAMTQPADARMADRVALARHIFAVVGASRDRTRGDRDDTLVGWAAALWRPPIPTRWADTAAADTLDALADGHAARLGRDADDLEAAFASTIDTARADRRMPAASRGA